MHTNALIREKSPYLLQHAHNPVDWLAWGEEAFRKARTEQKPIFLSIGYSTCHWCHVMERESFENEQTADLLNRFFIPIKVDREERPDVDRVYMTFVQASTGSGGWPMSVFLTPELKPFFGGTYFPPEPRYGHPGFSQVLKRVAEAWALDRTRIVESSGTVIAELGAAVDSAPAPIAPDASVLDSGFYAFRRAFDSLNGGFGGAPKFPRPVTLNFLLRYWARTGNAEARDMALDTLRAMARGGIYDHLGGGFHRYAVDERWHVPHFEKMLYDQAQLAISYLEAFQVSGDELYARVARDTLDYVLRDLCDPEGGFYSAEDADSQGREGAFYVWSQQEIEDVLDPADAERWRRCYGVEERGNVSADSQGEFAGLNILYLPEPPEDGLASLDDSRQKLLEARSRRPRPSRDDKILTAWNGLMISALAKGARILDEARYREAALRVTGFLLSHLYDSQRDMLLRRFCAGDAAIAGFLDDYAFFAQALLDLYETVFEVRYLDLAIRLTDSAMRLFADSNRGGFFSSAAGDGSLVLRMKDDYDGAEPSGNSVTASNLLRLAEMTGRDKYREAAEGVLRLFAPHFTSVPMSAPQMLTALSFHLGRRRQIVIVGDRNAQDTQAFLRAVHHRFLPESVVLLVDGKPARSFLSAFRPAVPATAQGTAAAYVCRDYTCQLPVTNLEAFEAALDER
jgi:uncharacterized protein YyaL (SSP411 family)